jgi:hypothetical protein
MGKNVKVRNVNGFSLTLGHTGKEWSMDHRELGRNLGYESAGNFKHFLALVDRLTLEDPGFQALGPVSVVTERGVTTEGNAYKSRVLHFTRRQALYIVAKSHKAEAATVTLAMVDAFELVLSGAMPTAASFVPFLLREDFCEWDLMWSPPIISALCKMHRQPYTSGGPVPHFLASTMEKIYRLVWGDEVYRAVKATNQEPSRGKNHHQALIDKARERFRAQLPFIEHTALDSSNKVEFWARLENVYRGYSMQLRLSGMQAPSNTNAAAATRAAV